ncbi:hypothetical protein B0J12DRAFT_172547 [Macrophomina phaseolina]|uniref:NmrA-like domain-containing protein n=1 Tax=Macrophomina phaseolina TaxID=35725 RepID=A0ABQ8GSU7_9PEZI|nr:hypothetical protein B0J12DRAFT_172547 [Macrophomina phaseolina]
MSQAILVTGATGNQGGAVIDALLSQKRNDLTILAVTRDASSASAKRLANKSPTIKLVQGNLDNVPALFDAAAQAAAPAPIWGVYSVQISMGRGVTLESEVHQGTSLIDASIARGVSHFVYSSVERGGDAASWDNPTPVPHFQSKQRIEQHLRSAAAGTAMSWTVLRPVAFMDNLTPGLPTKLFLTALRDTLGAKPMQWVAVADIGAFAALAFANPDEWRDRAIGLAGDELTFEELSESFEKATGYPAPVSYSFLGNTLMYMVTEVNLMIGWFASDGYRADIGKCRQAHPKLLDLETWLVKKSLFETREN